MGTRESADGKAGGETGGSLGACCWQEEAMADGDCWTDERHGKEFEGSIGVQLMEQSVFRLRDAGAVLFRLLCTCRVAFSM